MQKLSCSDKPHSREEHFAIVIGQIDSHMAPMVRLHSQCMTGDILGSLKCDCGPQLQTALAQMQAAGGGVLLYLAQEGRDIGLLNKIRPMRCRMPDLIQLMRTTN